MHGLFCDTSSTTAATTVPPVVPTVAEISTMSTNQRPAQVPVFVIVWPKPSLVEVKVSSSLLVIDAAIADASRGQRRLNASIELTWPAPGRGVELSVIVVVSLTS